MTTVRVLTDVKALKACRAGERVSFRARVLRAWETGGLRMCLVGDESALTRVELGGAVVEPGLSYEFREGLVQEYPSTSLRAGPSTSLRAGPSTSLRAGPSTSLRAGPGGWHSVSLAAGGTAVPLAEDVPVTQDEAYIERTYRILAGVQRKKARREGRIPLWRHPASGEPEPRTKNLHGKGSRD